MIAHDPSLMLGGSASFRPMTSINPGAGGLGMSGLPIPPGINDIPGVGLD